MKELRGFATEVGKILCNSSPEERGQFCYSVLLLGCDQLLLLPLL